MTFLPHAENHNEARVQRPTVRVLLPLVLLVSVSAAGCLNDNPFTTGPRLPHDYIVDDDYSKWIIEVDYVDGHAPTQSALDLLKQRMAALVHKDSITITTNGGVEGRSTWTDDAIRATSTRHLDQKSGSGTVVTHVLYLDGSYSKGSVLGVTYGNKEVVAMFDETISNSANLFFSASTIERAVLVHEFGHVLGLVNTGTPMAQNHEDPENSGHSNNRDSVMYWAVETTDVTQIFTGGLPNSFDQADRNDICKAGGKC